MLDWSPPQRLKLAWRIRLDWVFDPSLLTEIEVSFTDVGNGETEVRIVHSGFENLGEGGEAALEIFDGWGETFAGYARVLHGLSLDKDLPPERMAQRSES